MRSYAAARRWTCALGAMALGLAMAPQAEAFEAMEGRIQVHGFGEMQIRGLARDFEAGDDWDLAQWYNVLNIEAEFDIAPDGWGPFSLISAYARIEGRYDCVWTRGCGMLRSADTFGDRARHLPRRMSDGHRSGFSATQVDASDVNGLPDGDVRSYSGVGLLDLGVNNKVDLNRVPNPEGNTQSLAAIFQVPGLATLFTSEGADGLRSTTFDSPAFGTFAPIRDYKFGIRRVPGTENGNGTQILGPLLPKNKIVPNGILRTRPNPIRGVDGGGVTATAMGFVFAQTGRAADFNPIIPVGTGMSDTVSVGTEVFETCTQAGASCTPLRGFDLPFRPAPLLGLTDPNPNLAQAQGLYYPNSAVARLLANDRFDSFDQNFRQAELAWNRGGSQQDEKELKELYFDLELFDGRLWSRIGKQNIVWGKTELFRTTDQFNPQDLALATLPSLEESRIGLWAARFVWSFYDVGPVDDLRLEFAFNYDQFEPDDLGRCGEPYTAFAACNVTLGLFGNGVTGAGIAGHLKPPDPWNSFKGIEAGIRTEFRWSRFSFAISDFYGYTDLPIVERVFTYERNVDPRTGRPRRNNSRAGCDPDNLFDGDTSGCLNPGVDALTNHHANQQLFAVICSSSVGFSSLDPSVCAQSVLNSVNLVSGLIPVAPAISALVGARTFGKNTYFGLLNATVGLTAGQFWGQMSSQFGTTTPSGLAGDLNGDGLLVGSFGDLPLVTIPDGADLCARTIADAGYAAAFPALTAECLINPDPDGPHTPPSGVGFLDTLLAEGITGLLTDQEEALLGCGPFYSSNCDLDGIDLLNAEASYLLQAWPGIEGTGSTTELWDIFDSQVAQPATFPAELMPNGETFDGNDGCGRWENNQFVIVAGCEPQFLPDGTPNPAWRRDVGGTSPSAPEVLALRDNGTAVDRVTLSDFLRHPYACADYTDRRTCQRFVSGGAAVSFNALMGFVGLSAPDSFLEVDLPMPEADFALLPGPEQAQILADLGLDPNNCVGYNPAAANPIGSIIGACFKRAGIDDFDVNDIFRTNGCSFRRPQLCSNIQSVFAITDVKRNTLRAGSRTRFGRRDFTWHDGAQAALTYEKRNVLGFSTDFAEDITKSNWSLEATWIEGVPQTDNDEFDGLTRADEYNLTISVDRPTFINFMNPNRTFFINSQWFFQYVKNYTKGFSGRGPWNFLFTFSVFTGYFQDRLNPAITMVYDVRSNSGAFLPEIEYRFSERFSATVGFAGFFGRFDRRRMPVNAVGGSGNHVGKGAYGDFTERGLSVVQDRDEAFLKLRYTF